MLVDISLTEPVADRVWFEPRTMLLSVEINGSVESIDFRLLPPEDFESPAPIIKFELGQQGAVVLCHHQDGETTWLPVDMWLPGGFTPPVQSSATVGRN